jgi:hypothetical protein
MKILLILTSFVFGVKFQIFARDSSIPKYELNDNLPEKLKSPLTGGFKSCFLAKLRVESVEFVVRVDTGSSDTVVASRLTNNFSGSSFNFSFPGNQPLVGLNYHDMSYWLGYVQRIACGISDISAICPIALIIEQSTSPLFLDEESNISGLIGVGFPSLSAATLASPQTVMDAWFNSGQIEKKQLAIHGCTYERESESYIDIGNESLYEPAGCTNFSATIGIPSPSYYNLDILQITFANSVVPLNSAWQTVKVSTQLYRRYSVLDSCTSVILLPTYMVTLLKNQVIASGGLSAILGNVYLNDWLNGMSGVAWNPNSIKWELLPEVSLTIKSQTTNQKNVTLVLGPRQYIQLDDTGLYCKSNYC